VYNTAHEHRGKLATKPPLEKRRAYMRRNVMNNTDTAQKINDFKEEGKDKFKKATEAAQNVADKVTEKTEELKEQFEECKKTFSEYIQNCPLRSIATATAVGLLLGFLIKK